MNELTAISEKKPLVATVHFVKNRSDQWLNKRSLSPGVDYLVMYRDVYTKRVCLAGATWNGENFVFCLGKFIERNSAPALKNTGCRHLIIGWCKLSDWRENHG
jgi:hypothetical protein